MLMFKWLMMLVLLPLLACQGQAQREGTVAEDIDVKAFKEKVEKLENEQVLDVRTPEEWAAGTLKDAHQMNIFDADFKEKIGALDKDRPVLVYCKAGGRSSRAMKVLNDAGFKEVYNLKGGITAWKAAGYEVVQ